MPPNSTSTGKQAEEMAAAYLVQRGFTICARNWRTRWCEIDIVAAKEAVLYFVEVKYRASDIWGSGLDYITAKKRRQMHFAAVFWLSTHKWDGDYLLSAIEVSGAQFEVGEFVADVR